MKEKLSGRPRDRASPQVLEEGGDSEATYVGTLRQSHFIDNQGSGQKPSQMPYSAHN